MKKIFFILFKNVSKVFYGSGIGKLPLIMTVYKRLLSFFSPNTVKVGSLTYHLDSQDALGLSVFGFNDETQVRLIQREVKKNWTVVDVGAHIGYYTMMYASLVGSKGKVYAFEPSKKTFKTLQANIKANNFNNVIAENKAVSNKKTTLKFYESDNSLTNRIANSKTETNFDTIQAVRLDDYFKKINTPIDFVKIDVEGAELQVLQGMEALLRKNKKITLLIEFCPEHLAEYSVNSEEILTFLEKLGFSFFDVSDKKKSIKSISKKKLIETYKSGLTNIFCTRY